MQKDNLAIKMAKAGADLKLQYYEEIEDLRVKQQTLQKKLDHLKESSDDAW